VEEPYERLRSTREHPITLQERRSGTGKGRHCHGAGVLGDRRDSADQTSRLTRRRTLPSHFHAGRPPSRRRRTQERSMVGVSYDWRMCM
jgi:hypothetical protein